MTPTEIKELIKQELIRENIADVKSDLKADQKKERSALSKFFAHPFMLTASGFLFTFFITTWIESVLAERRNIIQAREAAIERIAEEAEARKASVLAIDTAARERVVASDMLRSGLSRVATEEIEERKENYDAAYVNWTTHLRANLIFLRQIEPETQIHAQAIETHVQKYFSWIDRCLTIAYDAHRGRGAVNWKCPQTADGSGVDWRAVRSHSKIILNCLDMTRVSANLEIDLAQARDQDQIWRNARATLDKASAWGLFSGGSRDDVNMKRTIVNLEERVSGARERLLNACPTLKEIRKLQSPSDA